MKYIKGNSKAFKHLEKVFQREELKLRLKMKKMLTRCSPQEQAVFGLMYDPKKHYGNPVDAIDFEKLDWAFCQIEKALDPIRKIEKFLNGEREL